jgi:hypothetical protein
MKKQVVTTLNAFFSFIVTFQEHKAHNILNMMLEPCYKGLRLVIQYVGKNKTMQIIREYDRYVLFPFLVHAYKNFNLIVTIEVVPSVVNIEKVTSLYDFMEIDDGSVNSLKIIESLHDKEGK